MADAIKVSVDMQDLKVLNDYLNTTEDKIDMTAKTAKKSFNQLKMAIDPAYRATKIFKDQVLISSKGCCYWCYNSTRICYNFCSNTKTSLHRLA